MPEGFPQIVYESEGDSGAPPGYEDGGGAPSPIPGEPPTVPRRKRKRRKVRWSPEERTERRSRRQETVRSWLQLGADVYYAARAAKEPKFAQGADGSTWSLPPLPNDGIPYPPGLWPAESTDQPTYRTPPFLPTPDQQPPSASPQPTSIAGFPWWLILLLLVIVVLAASGK